MQPATRTRLERLKNHSTRYEIIAAKGERSVLICYGAKSRRAIVNALLASGAKRLHLLATSTETRAEDWQVEPNGSCYAVTCDGWVIMPSGRTQREAYMHGETPETIYAVEEHTL